MRHRETSIEWPLPCTLTRCDTTTDAGDLVPAVPVEARIDPSSGVFDQRLEDGIWDVLARADFLGEGNAAPVRFAGRQPGGQTRLAALGPGLRHDRWPAGRQAHPHTHRGRTARTSG